MVQFVPESPCTPPMSPSSASDLEKKCNSAQLPDKLAIPAVPQQKEQAPEQSDAAAVKEEPAIPEKSTANTGDEVLSEVSETTSATTNEPKIELNNVRIRIQKRPNQLRETEEIEYETFMLPTMILPEKPTLDSIRDALLSCELGRPERDIFFPTWTKSLYICWRLTSESEHDDNNSTPSSPSSAAPEPAESSSPASAPDSTPASAPAPAKEEEQAAEVSADEVKFSETETVESDESLQAAVAREQATPGSLCLLLQECRNARYSRKRDKRAGKMGSARPHSPKNMYNPNMYYGQAPIAFPVYAEAGSGKSCGDGTVYFDGPLTFAYPLQAHPGYGCTPGHSGGAVGHYPAEFAYLPPYAMVPFMYSPHGAQH